MSQLRVAWGAPAPHANIVGHPFPVHNAPASFANSDNSSGNESPPHGTAPSTPLADGDTRLHAGCGMSRPLALPHGYVLLGESRPATY
ncbi:hypothetical protein D3C77_588130 [compost metagenome]